MTTVLVAARGAARARLEAVVAAARGLRLVSGLPDAPLARQLRALRPDVVLLDLDGRRLDALLAELPDPAPAALVLLADAPRRARADLAVERGLVRAVLPRDATSGEILAAIDAVVGGLVVLHPDALDVARGPRARREAQPARGAADPAQPLTAREIEVLGMLAEGLGNKAIASRLGISTHTAKFHVASILAKLGAGGRTEAVTIGMRRGLVVI
ncbi:MAG TPA: response regulator transcription factor [Planctomycetota bacterium]|nr:response regulator transcription factor [Planctomycetota bacterium]